MNYKLEIVSPGIVAAVVEVVQVTLVLVGLAFERDLPIGIAASAQPHQPLDHIPDVKPHNGHLQQLCRVYPLMVDELLRQVNAWMHEEYTQQVDGAESAHGDIFGTDYFHYCVQN